MNKQDHEHCSGKEYIFVFFFKFGAILKCYNFSHSKETVFYKILFLIKCPILYEYFFYRFALVVSIFSFKSLYFYCPF